MNDRQKWGSRTAFILAAVGSAVGLGNVWRFPFVAYQNGGGAFFIPYFVALIAAGIPIMLLEYGLGIFYQKGAPSALEEISPKFKWVGWVALLVGLSISFYYVPVIGWSWKYLMASPDLEWTQPTRSGTVYLVPYETYGSSSEKNRIEKGLREAGQGGVRLIKKGRLSDEKSRLKSRWDRKVEVFVQEEGRADEKGTALRKVQEFIRSTYSNKTGDIEPDTIRVLLLPSSYLTTDEKQRNIRVWARQFYDGKLEGKEDSKWLTRVNPNRTVDLIKIKKNAQFYFQREVLGGYSPKEWKTENLISKALTRMETRKDDFAPGDLNPKYFVTEKPLSKLETKSGIEVTPGLIDRVRSGGGGWKDQAHSFYRAAGLFLARFDVDLNKSFSEKERQAIASHLETIRSEGGVDVHFLETLTPAYARHFGALRDAYQKMERAETDEEESAFRREKVNHQATLRTSLDKLLVRRQAQNGGGTLGSRMRTHDRSLVFWCFITWFLIFLIIYNGVDTVGKVVLWTVPLPVLLLGALIVRGLMMPGAMTGLEHYLSPEWSAVANPAVWREAFGQIFFTLSLGFGIMIAYASYMPDDSDVANNSFMTSFANCATSFYAGFAVFSVLGGLATILHVPVEEVAQDGPGLVFTVYPVALSELPGGGIWGVLFFLSLLMLGIDSAFSIVEAVVTGLNDIFPEIPRQVIVTVICILGALVSVMLFCQRAGVMWLSIMDKFISSSFGLPLVGLLECVAVGLFFDTETFREKINAQSEFHVQRWWNVFVQLLIPAVLSYLLLDAVVQYADLEMGIFHKISANSVLIAGWMYFGFLLFLAFLFGGSVTGVIWLLSGVVMTVVFGGLPGMTWGMAMMMSIGILLLFGGFLTCLTYVRTGTESDTAETSSDGDVKEKEHMVSSPSDDSTSGTDESSGRDASTS